MTKKQRALEIIERLKKEYPDSDCTLDYDQAWKLLVSVRLAAQCTDARVNVIVEKLYEKFPDVNALAEAPVEKIEEIVRPCGLCVSFYQPMGFGTDVTLFVGASDFFLWFYKRGGIAAAHPWR